ncbi:hypothetical protein BH23PLA1_BH23PLA1_29570 [soil metagenome]
MSVIGSLDIGNKENKVYRVVDIRDYGAKPLGVIDGPLQDAIDDLGSRGGGTIRIPGEQFYSLVGRVFIDRNNITLAGDGMRTTTIACAHSSANIAVGVHRSGVGRDMGAGHWIDLTGLMDGTQGQRWGFRTRDPVGATQAWLSFPGTALSLGKRADWWATTPQYTSDHAFYEPTESVAPGVFFGACDQRFLGCPGLLLRETVATWPNTEPVFAFYFGTGPYEDEAFTIRSVRFHAPGGTITPGIQRITIQVDLDAATVSVWYNRVQVAVDFTTIGAGWTAGAGLRLTPSQHAPFNIGSLGETSIDNSIDGNWGENSATLDRTHCALRITGGLLYADDGVGQSQRRFDDTTITDHVQFYSVAEPGLIALVPFDRGPDHPEHHSPVVFCGNGSPGSYEIDQGILIGPLNRTQFISKRTTIRDLAIGGPRQWGKYISIGAALYVNVENVHIDHMPVHGIGGINLGPSYGHTIKGCELAGWDASYWGYWHIITILNTNIRSPGRCAIRIKGGVLSFKESFMTEAQPFNEYMVYCMSDEAGGSTTIQNILLDTEFYSLPKKALIRQEASEYLGGDQLAVRDTVAHMHDNGAAFVELAMPPGWLGIVNLGTPHATIENCKSIGITGSVVRVNDRAGLWTADIRGWTHPGAYYSQFPAAHRSAIRRMVHHVLPQSLGRVRCEMPGFTLPPRKWDWDASSFRLPVVNPRPGQYSEWINPVGGPARSSEPAQWVGINPLSVPGHIAGYAIATSFAQGELSNF